MDAKTWTSSPPEAYPLMLGALFANLASLEIALRVAVYLCETPVDRRVPAVANWLTSLRTGEVHELSALTSWDSLGELIAKYNKYCPNDGVPDDITPLRDALAHGRILTDNPTSELKLIRFSRPKKNDSKVTVEMVQTMSIEWLGQQLHRVHDTVATVRQRVRELAPD